MDRRTEEVGVVLRVELAGRSTIYRVQFASGSRCLAASALRLAGGRVVAAVVVGRVIRPEWSKESAALWKAARGRRFSFDTCCLELDVPPEPPFDLDAS